MYKTTIAQQNMQPIISPSMQNSHFSSHVPTIIKRTQHVENDMPTQKSI